MVLVHVIIDPRPISILVTYCCIINYPQKLVARNSYYLTDFVGQELRYSLAGPLLRVLSQVTVSVHPGSAAASEVSTGEGFPTGLLARFSLGLRFFAGFWEKRLSVPCCIALSKMAACFIKAGKRENLYNVKLPPSHSQLIYWFSSHLRLPEKKKKEKERNVSLHIPYTSLHQSPRDSARTSICY